MDTTKNAMKMPEILVFVRTLVVGWLAAEICRIAYYLGTAFATDMADYSLMRAILITGGLAICAYYARCRGAHVSALQMGRSLRIDLLIVICLGVWSNELTAPWLSKFHAALKASSPHWGAVSLLLLCTLLLSPLFQRHFPGRRQTPSHLRFLADEEIRRESDDLLSNETQAKSFAETVLASSAHSGLVFGVDGPWGVGKTSFINLAEQYWKRAADKVIVCRFEPLRYASEPDLADRLIRDLSASIQKQVFAPEFRPAASRYSRLIKGKADVSFLGFKLSLEPSQETVDELLDDIDLVLRRIGRRIIVVIDDLDRLDPKTVNNVLFATRRTFKLSQATYILCYDTEVLTAGQEDASRARDFFEKFVTVKLSLFVDSSSISKFLRRDWERAESQLDLIPSDTMLKLGAILNELANILDSGSAAKYLPLVGNLRKIKRFINAILLMQIEKTDLGRTDFDKRDLINLMLLHLYYPGLFRRIYAEETEGRSGTYSVRRGYDTPEFFNAEGFSQVMEEHLGSAKYLLEQLFDVEVLELNAGSSIEELVFRSRACFNHTNNRNLENYLKLIVRFVAPEPQETFILYRAAVDRVRQGQSIASLLAEVDFSLEGTEDAHDQFWRVLVNQAHDFTSATAEDAIETLVESLPSYSSYDNEDRGLRPRSIYSLLRLLDQAGWGRTTGRRLTNSPEHVIEIAWRIFGEREFFNRGILERLASPDRGVLGWNDLMLFRLQCSADRGSQLYNLHTALILDQDPSAQTTGAVDRLALLGMRKLSQGVFALFKRAYIDAGRNFIADANEIPIDALLGKAYAHLLEQPSSEHGDKENVRQVASARSFAASFVIYQLSNSEPPNRSGVGCGHYDESGAEDGCGISRLMNEYIFGVCFNPTGNDNNVLLFLDHCLSHLSSPFRTGRDDEGYIATMSGLTAGLSSTAMGRYWLEHRDHIRGLELQDSSRRVFMPRYTAIYREDLDGVFAVLDELAEEVASDTPALEV